MRPVPAVTLPALALFAVLAAAPAGAQSGAIHLAWDNCPAGGVVLNRTFACDANTGVDILVASFVSPDTLPQFVGLEATIQVTNEPGPIICDPFGQPPGSFCAPPLPPWWHLESGGCRPASLSAGFDFFLPPFDTSPCVDPWRGLAQGGLAYDFPNGPGGPARLRVIAAVAQNNALGISPNLEYFGFRIAIQHQKTTGTTVCDGCCTPVTLQLVNFTLVQPAPIPDTIALPTDNLFYATYQGAQSPCITPVRHSTWGGIKSLYR